MPENNSRQKAEDHYYAALDLVAEGQHERALGEYQQSLAADPAFTEAMHGMARTLQDHCRAKLAPYKYPRWLEFRGELPKTATGKIQRFKLRAEADAIG